MRHRSHYRRNPRKKKIRRRSHTKRKVKIVKSIIGKENSRVLRHKNKLSTSTISLPVPVQFVETLTPSKMKKIGKYKIIGILGEGGFGKVFLGWDDDIKNYVAIKKGEIKHIQKELDFLQEPVFAKNCHRFLCLNDAFKYDGAAYIVTDLVTGTSLYEVPKRIWQSNKAKEIVKQIYEQMRFLHDEARIVHRDLSTENMLYDIISNRITFIDFGLSCQSKKGKKFHCEPGGYAAISIQPKDNPSRFPKTENQFIAADIYMTGKSLSLAIKNVTSLSSTPKLVREYIKMATTFDAKDRLKKFHAFQSRIN